MKYKYCIRLGISQKHHRCSAIHEVPLEGASCHHLLGSQGLQNGTKHSSCEPVDWLQRIQLFVTKKDKINSGSKNAIQSSTRLLNFWSCSTAIERNPQNLRSAAKRLKTQDFVATQFCLSFFQQLSFEYFLHFGTFSPQWSTRLQCHSAPKVVMMEVLLSYASFILTKVNQLASKTPSKEPPIFSLSMADKQFCLPSSPHFSRVKVNQEKTSF